MLRLILGRAGTGKTMRVMNEIKDKARSGETGLILLVPEQYSHDAERRLCSVVGDSLSLHGDGLDTQLGNSGFTGGTGFNGEVEGSEALLGLVLVGNISLDNNYLSVVAVGLAAAHGVENFGGEGHAVPYAVNALVLELKDLVVPVDLDELNINTQILCKLVFE